MSRGLYAGGPRETTSSAVSTVYVITATSPTKAMYTRYLLHGVYTYRLLRENRTHGHSGRVCHACVSYSSNSTSNLLHHYHTPASCLTPLLSLIVSAYTPRIFVFVLRPVSCDVHHGDMNLRGTGREIARVPLCTQRACPQARRLAMRSS